MIAYFVGMFFERFELTVFIILGVTLVLVLVTVPGWPLFRTSEPEWLDHTKLQDYVREAGIKEKKAQ